MTITEKDLKPCRYRKDYYGCEEWVADSYKHEVRGKICLNQTSHLFACTDKDDGLFEGCMYDCRHGNMGVKKR